MMKKFEVALKSGKPLLTLRDMMIQLRAEGISKETLLTELEALRGRLRLEDAEEDEDTVLEVMDFLAGNCSPHMRID